MAALLAAAASLLTLPALADEAATFFSGDSQHRRVLTQRIDESLRQQVAAEVFGGVDAGIAGFGIAFGALTLHDEPRAALSYVVGFGLVDGAALSSLFMTRDARSNVLEGIIFATPAIAGLGFAIADNPGSFPRLTSSGIAAGYAIAGTLTIINRALMPTRYSQLRTLRARLDDPRDLSEAERRGMHYTLLGARGPIPRWLIGAPMLIGGAVAAAPLFDNGYDRHAHLIAGLLGCSEFLTGLLYLLPGAVDRYESDLETLSISVAAAPGGVALTGTF